MIIGSIPNCQAKCIRAFRHEGRHSENRYEISSWKRGFAVGFEMGEDKGK